MRDKTVLAFRSLAAGCCLLFATGCRESDADPDLRPQQVSPARELSHYEQAATALARGNFPAAESAITKHLLGNPVDPRGLELAGDLAAASSDPATAIELYRSAIEHAAPAMPSLYEKLGRQLMTAGDPYGAAEQLRASLAANPDSAKTRADFAGLVASLGMVRDAAEHLRWLLRRGKGGLNELIMLADLSVPQTDAAICDYALQQNPKDRRPLYPLALTDALEGNWDRAAERLAEVTDAHPDFAPAWAFQGRVLVELGRDEALQRWLENLPPDCDQWIEYWLAAGHWAEKNGRPGAAAAAFWKAVQIDDAHGEALVHLAANLAQSGMADQSQVIANRAADVNAMHDSIESLFSWRKNSQQAALEVAKAMKQLGRPWEAEAWARGSLAMTQQLDPDARLTHQGFLKALKSSTPWNDPERSLTRQVDLADGESFRWALSSQSAPPPDSVSAGAIDDSSGGIRFEDQSILRGLIHTCAISQQESEESIAIYQSNAGSAGVIDFDLDGWPDVYLTMIDGQPLKSDSSPNRLFRNLAGQFTDATNESSVGDRGFSQGVAVGDYNADGFTDLWVANIGRNHLYRNNGDGTFSDVTDEVGLTGQQWTTSVAIADFDGDSIADLFEVQYCAGDQAYSQKCIDSELGEPRSCSPLVFAAELDRAWQGQPKGSFSDVSANWLVDQKPGHGLGLVVGRIDDQVGLDVYVANDMTANHFWSSQRTEDSHRFSEQAAIRGLAVNSRSQSQASMGMALGDADADGDLDLFLTHFTDDYDTLYEQIAPGTWFDKSSTVGLDVPTNRMLGFGTEWIDANNDGAPELMVANGNVDDFSHQGHSLRMKPQFFSRTPSGTWNQVGREGLGKYFQSSVVGRSLVTVDVDRDGLTDVIVTHLFDPVAALVNQSVGAGSSIRIDLRGRQTGRDAIGAIVHASVDGQRRMSQLTTGDGFQCSNERCVRLGLGQSDRARDVVIEWPSGNRQAIGDLEAGQEYIVIEGIDESHCFGPMPSSPVE